MHLDPRGVDGHALMFVASREPRPEWLAECRRVAPPAEHRSHLTVHWLPGTPEAPIQRWLLFECVPRAYAKQLPGLGSLDPESPDPMIRWAWEYWTAHDALPVPTWVVQGTDGGHPYAWTENERILAQAGLLEPKELPLPGDLPYAEPDARAFRALEARRKVLALVQDPHHARMIARNLAQQKARAWDLVETEAHVADTVTAATRDFMAHAKVIDRDEARDVGGLVTDEDLARYVETGDLTVSR